MKIKCAIWESVCDEIPESKCFFRNKPSEYSRNPNCQCCDYYHSIIVHLLENKPQEYELSPRPGDEHPVEDSSTQKPKQSELVGDREEPKEFIRWQFERFLAMQAHPEFQRIKKLIHRMDEKIDRALEIHGGSSLSQQQKVGLEHRVASLEKRRELLLSNIRKKFNFEIPEMAFENITRRDFENTSFFSDEEVVKDIFYKKPLLMPSQKSADRSTLDLDETNYLRPDPSTGRPRYWTVEIDTWNTPNRIIEVLKKKLEPFVKESRSSREFKLSDEEREQALKLKSEGMSPYKIAQELRQTSTNPVKDDEFGNFYKRILRFLQSWELSLNHRSD